MQGQMIIQSASYSFKKPLVKVHQCLPAVDDSLVVLHAAGLGKDCLTHFDSKSTAVFAYSFNELVDTLGMLTAREAIVLLVRTNKILVVDLVSHEVKLYNHCFIIDVSCQVNLFTYNSSRLLCISENGTYNNHILHLTYYHHPLTNGPQENPQPIAQFHADQAEWTYQFSIRQGNAHSMVLWFRSRQDQDIEIRCFDLRDDSKGAYRVLVIKNTLGDAYGVDRVNLSLQEVWEMRAGVFFLVGFSDKADKKCRNSRGNVIDNYVWDISKGIIKEAKVQFDPQFNPFQIHSQSCGDYSMIRTFHIDHKGPRSSPAVFINNSTQEVESSEEWVFSHRSKWVCPGYSSSLFVEAEYDNAPVYEIKVKSRLFVPRRILSYHLLSQAYPSLDCSLLNDSVSLLDY